MKDQLVTIENFTARQSDFLKANPDLWLMIRPDRDDDKTTQRYPDDEARRNGNTATKDWFEYLAAKVFFDIFNTWRSLLKSGRSIMVVCADPLAFDLKFVPPEMPVLAADFWDEFERSRIPVDHRHETVGHRERCLVIIKNCAANLRMKAAPALPSVRPLREWKSIPIAAIDASKQPPPLSDELRAKIGIGMYGSAAE